MSNISDYNILIVGKYYLLKELKNDIYLGKLLIKDLDVYAVGKAPYGTIVFQYNNKHIPNVGSSIKPNIQELLTENEIVEQERLIQAKNQEQERITQEKIQEQEQRTQEEIQEQERRTQEKKNGSRDRLNYNKGDVVRYEDGTSYTLTSTVFIDPAQYYRGKKVSYVIQQKGGVGLNKGISNFYFKKNKSQKKTKKQKKQKKQKKTKKNKKSIRNR